MKKIISCIAGLSLSFLAVACGSDSKDTAAAPAAAPVWTNTTMQNLVATRCATAGCHAGTVAPNFSNITEAAMKANTKAATQVAAGTMPKAGTTPFTATEKAVFANFYK